MKIVSPDGKNLNFVLISPFHLSASRWKLIIDESFLISPGSWRQTWSVASVTLLFCETIKSKSDFLRERCGAFSCSCADDEVARLKSPISFAWRCQVRYEIDGKWYVFNDSLENLQPFVSSAWISRNLQDERTRKYGKSSSSEVFRVSIWYPNKFFCLTLSWKLCWYFRSNKNKFTIHN